MSIYFTVKIFTLKILSKIGDGILIGIGFCIIYIPSYLAVSSYSMDSTLERLKSEEFSDSVGVVVSEHRRRDSNMPIVILGAVTNQGTSSWDNVRLQAYFYDKGGYFVDKCFGSMNVTLHPGDSDNFKLRCEDIIESESYEIKVSYASYVKKQNKLVGEE